MTNTEHEQTALCGSSIDNPFFGLDGEFRKVLQEAMEHARKMGLETIFVALNEWVVAVCEKDQSLKLVKIVSRADNDDQIAYEHLLALPGFLLFANNMKFEGTVDPEVLVRANAYKYRSELQPRSARVR